MFSQTFVFIACAVFTAQSCSNGPFIPSFPAPSSPCGCSRPSGVEVVSPSFAESVYPNSEYAEDAFGFAPYADVLPPSPSSCDVPNYAPSLRSFPSYAPSVSSYPSTLSRRYDSLPVVQAPPVFVNRPTASTIQVPAPSTQSARVIAHECICKKTIVRPQYIKRLVQEQGVQRFVKTSYRPVVEKVPYIGRPVGDSSCGLPTNSYPESDVVGTFPASASYPSGFDVDSLRPSSGVAVDSVCPSYGRAVDTERPYYGPIVESARPSYGLEIDSVRPSYNFEVDSVRPSYGITGDFLRPSCA